MAQRTQKRKIKMKDSKSCDFKDETCSETTECSNKSFVKKNNLLHQILRLEHVKRQNYFYYKSATSGAPWRERCSAHPLGGVIDWLHCESVLHFLKQKTALQAPSLRRANCLHLPSLRSVSFTNSLANLFLSST